MYIEVGVIVPAPIDLIVETDVSAALTQLYVLLKRTPSIFMSVLLQDGDVVDIDLHPQLCHFINLFY